MAGEPIPTDEVYCRGLDALDHCLTKKPEDQGQRTDLGYSWELYSAHLQTNGDRPAARWALLKAIAHQVRAYLAEANEKHAFRLRSHLSRFYKLIRP